MPKTNIYAIIIGCAVRTPLTYRERYIWMIKRYLAIGCVSILLIAMAGIAANTEVYQVPKEEPQVEVTEKPSNTKYEDALAEGADLLFWYDEISYEPYFTSMARAYYDETGIAVELAYVDTMDYVGSIYEKTMANVRFPDAYLLSGEELEKAHLYGVAGENENEAAYLGVVANNAIKASKCHGKMFGYPLSYNVCLLVYNNQFFQTPPESLQAIIDYSDVNEPPENVEYLLEWDAYDPFFGFLFVSESVVLNDEEIGVLEASYDEAMLEQSLLFFSESLESFSLPLDTVTEESVISDVLNGVTLCAIVDADSLVKLQGVAYDICEFPRLNDALDAQSAALTDMILVNDYSENKDMASDFAQFLTLENYESVWDMTGHYPVKLQSDADAKECSAYHAYENAILAPNSQDAGGFWIHIKELITNIIREQL